MNELESLAKGENKLEGSGNLSRKSSKKSKSLKPRICKGILSNVGETTSKLEHNIYEDTGNRDPLLLINGISNSLTKLHSTVSKQNASIAFINETVASQNASLATLNSTVANLNCVVSSLNRATPRQSNRNQNQGRMLTPTRDHLDNRSLSHRYGDRQTRDIFQKNAYHRSDEQYSPIMHHVRDQRVSTQQPPARAPRNFRMQPHQGIQSTLNRGNCQYPSDDQHQDRPEYLSPPHSHESQPPEHSKSINELSDIFNPSRPFDDKVRYSICGYANLNV